MKHVMTTTLFQETVAITVPLKQITHVQDFLLVVV